MIHREPQTLALALATELAPNVPVRSGLHVMEGSSPDRLSSDGVQTAPKFDALTAIPRIDLILSDDEGAREFVVEMGSGIGASAIAPGDLPVAAEAAARASFTVVPDGIRLTAPGLGRLFNRPIRIDERLKYFLELTRTVVLMIAVADGSAAYVLTIANGLPGPRFATRPGSIASKSFDSIVRNATWSLVEMPYAPLAGRGVHRHAHYEVYESRPTRTFLPSVSYVGRCILCGAAAGSKEHCVPDWLAAKELVEPVTSPLLCASCNNRFGSDLEAQICASWTDDGLPHLLRSADFALWATKTALTCSAAAGLRIPFAWSGEVGRERVPRGFAVYADRCRVPEPGYSFIVTTFDNTGSADGEFLFSFQCSDVYFAVTKSTEDLARCFGIARMYPDAAALGPASPTIREAHESAVELITGSPVSFSEGTGRRVRTRRTERS